jgi:hypothetical protein
MLNASCAKAAVAEAGWHRLWLELGRIDMELAKSGWNDGGNNGKPADRPEYLAA